MLCLAVLDCDYRDSSNIYWISNETKWDLHSWFVKVDSCENQVVSSTASFHADMRVMSLLLSKDVRRAKTCSCLCLSPTDLWLQTAPASALRCASFRFPFSRCSVFIVSLPQTPLRTISGMYLLMLCKVSDYKQVLVFFVAFYFLDYFKGRNKHTHTNTPCTTSPRVVLPWSLCSSAFHLMSAISI